MMRWLLALLLLLPVAADAQPVGPVPFSAFPDCQDTGGQHLNVTRSTGAFACGTTGSAGTSTGEWCVTWDSATTVTAATSEVSMPWTSGTITKIIGATNGTGSPSFSAAGQVGTTNITGCAALAVNSASEVNASCTAANTFSGPAAQLRLVISAPSGTPQQAYACLVFTHSAN